MPPDRTSPLNDQPAAPANEQPQVAHEPKGLEGFVFVPDERLSPEENAREKVHQLAEFMKRRYSDHRPEIRNVASTESFLENISPDQTGHFSDLAPVKKVQTPHEVTPPIVPESLREVEQHVMDEFTPLEGLMGEPFQDKFIELVGSSVYYSLLEKHDRNMKAMIAEARAEGLSKKKAE